MKRAGELRQQAEGYRRLKRQISDPRMVKALCQLAGEYEMTASELEKRQHIRERAHEIWIERGRPHGRDIEHWLAAERELAEESRRSQHIQGRA
jgi:transcription initiation factor TFIIIB Brf1 subunit/transcription initiation factor TFIIB